MISPLANLPNPANNLPTSAALSVRYFKHIPDSGSNVFSVSWAEGSRFGWAAAESVFDGAVSSFGFERAFVFGFLGREYFVVMRAEGYAWMSREDWCKYVWRSEK